MALHQSYCYCRLTRNFLSLIPQFAHNLDRAQSKIKCATWIRLKVAHGRKQESLKPFLGKLFFLLRDIYLLACDNNVFVTGLKFKIAILSFVEMWASWREIIIERQDHRPHGKEHESFMDSTKINKQNQLFSSRLWSSRNHKFPDAIYFTDLAVALHINFVAGRIKVVAISQNQCFSSSTRLYEAIPCLYNLICCEMSCCWVSNYLNRASHVICTSIMINK